MLPSNIVIQCALDPSELPGFVAKQIGCMYMRRYRPSPAIKAQRGFKGGTWKGCLAFALTDTGKVVGWAIKALPEGKKSSEVMTFVVKRYQRQGIGDALLDCCRTYGPQGPVTYYPHSPTAIAFYKYRELKLSGRKRGI